MGPSGGRRGGREVLHKSIVVGAVEQRAHTAGRARLAVLRSGRFEAGVDDPAHEEAEVDHATVRTDGFQPYRGSPRLGIRHDRPVQGLDPDASSEILPWVHRVFRNLKDLAPAE